MNDVEMLHDFLTKCDNCNILKEKALPFFLNESFFFTITEALFSLGPEELGTLDDVSKPDAKVFKIIFYFVTVQCCSVWFETISS